VLKIRYLKNKDINKEKWDNCIEHSQNETIYAYSNYLDIVAEHWDALIYEDYTAVMPLIWKKKHVVKYIYQPYFTQQSGIFSIHPIDALQIKQFLSAIPQKFVRIRMNLNYAGVLHDQGFVLKHNYILDLNKSYSDLYKHFNHNTKRNIIKANSMIRDLRKDIDPLDFVAFKKENSKLTLSDQPY
jgi:hypothetical protein